MTRGSIGGVTSLVSDHAGLYKLELGDDDLP